MNKRVLAMASFAAMTCVLWQPFNVHPNLYNTKRSKAIPAGEISRDFRLSQTVVPPDAPREKAPEVRNPCFAVQFATYARENRGSVRVQWRQGRRSQEWMVDAAGLADNTFVPFCPDPAFDPYRKFRVTVSGVDGEPGSSPTLWLVGDKRFGRARLSNPGVSGRSLALEVNMHTRIKPHPGLAGGLVLGWWLCTLAIGLAALAVGLGGRRDPVP